MNMTGTPPTDDESDDKVKSIEPADLLDENGRVDPAKVKARVNSTTDQVPRIDDSKCYDLRAAASRDDVEEIADIADEFAAVKGTIRYHVRGDCNCTPTIDPVTEITNSPISAPVCEEMRQFAADFDELRSADPIMAAFDVCSSTANRHISGRCPHATDAPSLSFDGYSWTVDEGTDATDDDTTAAETGGDPA